ncbi:MAG TPA: M2 family metallopeptidase [Candidatus Krumholzibacteria bacterium]|nr:M2 family metallopeptidase [Candidatus Krumholzibacteria bacterium]
MQTRTVAGLGMMLLAAGLMVIWYVGQQAGVRPKDPAPVAAGVPPQEAAVPGPAAVDSFLAVYNARYQALWTRFEGSNWDAEVDITEAHTAARIEAGQAMGAYVGSREVIDALRGLRTRSDLTPLQDREVDAAWGLASKYPATRPEVVDHVIKLAAVLSDSLYGHVYRLRLPGKPVRTVTPNDIDALLVSSRDLAERRAVWECSKQVGPKLKDGLADLRSGRNELARHMGYSSYFGLETANYGMSADQMRALMDELITGMAPLYEQLHCWVKHELARRYNAPVPRRIPAHWLGNRWAQEWPGIVEGVDMDGLFQDVQPSWLVRKAEDFYVSMGFEPLPDTFHERSDLYQLPPGSTRMKNTHASAWHIDLDRDVRALMSVEPDWSWFLTTHHELGHVYYYLSYSRPEVPPILREGANRAYHEGIGSLIELAATQPSYLVQLGLLERGKAPDRVAWLLNQALTGPVVYLPFACGTMTHFEYDLYEGDLPAHQFNARWWEYAGKYQGIEPPTLRGEEFCDAATKTHIIDDPAQYYDYAVAEVILHQLHRYICRELLHQDVHDANYFGDRTVGLYLQSILALGATRDGNLVMRQATGEDLSAEAMLEYYQPLMQWLQEQNAGRDTSF